MEELLECDHTRTEEKRVKEGLKMTTEDLEKMNMKLMRENENYVKAYQALQRDLHTAKAPEEVWIFRNGTCYHQDSCGHLPVNRANLGNAKTACQGRYHRPNKDVGSTEQEVTGVKIAIPMSTPTFGLANEQQIVRSSRGPLSILSRSES